MYRVKQDYVGVHLLGTYHEYGKHMIYFAVPLTEPLSWNKTNPLCHYYDHVATLKGDYLLEQLVLGSRVGSTITFHYHYSYDDFILTQFKLIKVSNLVQHCTLNIVMVKFIFSHIPNIIVDFSHRVSSTRYLFFKYKDISMKLFRNYLIAYGDADVFNLVGELIVHYKDIEILVKQFLAVCSDIFTLSTKDRNGWLQNVDPSHFFM